MSDITFSCPHCKQSLDIPEEMLGQAVACPACNGSIQLPEPEPRPAPAPPPPEPEPRLPQKPETKDCPYCGEDILAKARKCKHCGEFLDDSLKAQQQPHSQVSSTAGTAQRKPEQEKTEYKSHPAMFRNKPVGFILSVLLIVAYGLGLVILLIWWLRCLGTTLTVTNKKTLLRKGILSKHTNEVYHSDVRNVQVKQGIFQRIFGVGTIGIASAGHAGVEIEVSGLPRPAKIKDIIDRHRND